MSSKFENKIRKETEKGYTDLITNLEKLSEDLNDIGSTFPKRRY